MATLAAQECSLGRATWRHSNNKGQNIFSICLSNKLFILHGGNLVSFHTRLSQAILQGRTYNRYVVPSLADCHTVGQLSKLFLPYTHFLVSWQHYRGNSESCITLIQYTTSLMSGPVRLAVVSHMDVSSRITPGT